MVKRKRSQIVAASRKAAGGPDGASVVPVGQVEQAILLIRGERVILDADLAALYGVDTRVLNQAIRRNIRRFPEDFMFKLSQREHDNLKSQFVTSRLGWGGRRKLPLAFTEHGAIMAANVLNSSRAVQASVFVVRAFVRLRNVLVQHKELAAKLAELEGKIEKHDRQIIALIEAIRQLMVPPPEPPKKPIGFRTELGDGQGNDKLVGVKVALRNRRARPKV